MTARHFIRRMLLVVAALALAARPVQSQESLSGTVSAHLVVTVETKHGGDVPNIRRGDVAVYQGRDRAQMTDWIPLQGDHAGLELFVLLDDASATRLRSQLEDLRQFISSQLPTTLTGVGYMRDGTADIVRSLDLAYGSA
jgi:hypothetical protein